MGSAGWHWDIVMLGWDGLDCYRDDAMEWDAMLMMVPRYWDHAE